MIATPLHFVPALFGMAVACALWAVLLVFVTRTGMPGGEARYWIEVVVCVALGGTAPVMAARPGLRLAVAMAFVPCAIVVVVLFSVFFGCWLTGDCP